MAGPVIDDSRSPVLRVVGILVAVAVALALVVGLVLLVLSSGGDEGSEDSDGTEEAVDESDDVGDEEDPFDDFSDDFSGEPSEVTEDPAVPATTVPAPPDLFRDPTPLVEVWDDAVGRRAEVVFASVYEAHGSLTVRDPDRANRVNDYTWVNRSLDGPEADEPFPGVDLDRDSFPLSAIAFDRIPFLARRAPAMAGFPGGHVTHILIDRAFTEVPTMRIYVTSGDEVETTYVLATLAGRFTPR